jgi:hypothetical protein
MTDRPTIPIVGELKEVGEPEPLLSPEEQEAERVRAREAFEGEGMKVPTRGWFRVSISLTSANGETVQTDQLVEAELATGPLGDGQTPAE